MAVNSHEEAVALGQGRIVFEGTYKFHTPGSVNAPFGTFTLTIAETSELKASGTMTIHTLWGTTTTTHLTYTGEAQFDGGTGYTTVNGQGQGTMTYDYNKKRHIVANVNMSLRPGMIEGEVNITGFGEDMPCLLTKREIDDLPR
jgi:hypothetical protein